MRKSHHYAVLPDRVLIARVRDHLASLPPAEAARVSSAVLVPLFRAKYPEYARQSLQAFDSLCQKALESVRRGSRPVSPAPSVSPPALSPTPTQIQEASGFLNRQLRESYGKAQGVQRPREDDQESQRKQLRRRTIAAVKRTIPYDEEGNNASDIPQIPQILPKPRPDVRLRDVAGIDNALKSIFELVQCPLAHPELYKHLGVQPPRGILLHGPPGCGKTLLAHAIAGELGVPFYSLAAPEIVGGMSGESEAKLRGLFEEATKHAPSIVSISGTVSLAQGSPVPEGAGPVSAQFRIQMFAASGVKVASIQNVGESYKFYKGTRSLTRAGQYFFRA